MLHTVILTIMRYLTGNFKAGEGGTILKKHCNREAKCLKKLMGDLLRSYVPEYKGDVERDGESILSRCNCVVPFSAV